MKQKTLQSTQRVQFCTKNSKGFSLVEVILSMALFALLITAFVGSYLYGQEATMLAGNRARAGMLAEEGIEATRNIRDDDFVNLVDGTYGLDSSGGEWVFSGSSDSNGIFSREVIIGTISSNIKSVIVNLNWQQNEQRTGNLSLLTYLSNWKRIVQVLGDWSNPTQESTLNLSGNNNGLKVQILGDYAYIARSGGNDFSIIDVSNPASPSVESTLTLSGAARNIYVLGDYAYVSGTSNSQELQIIDISNPSSPSLVGTLNNSGNQNALGVYVVGTTAYLALDGGSEFSIVNVTVPSAPVIISTLNLSNDVNEVIVSGNYAYLASDSNSQELQVIDISNPLLPSQVASLNLSSNSNADTIAISGSTLFIGQGDDLRVVSISTPTSPVLVGTIDAQGTVNDISLNLGNSENYVYIATDDNDLEFQVIDVSTPASPVRIGSVNTTGNNNLNGITYDPTLDRAFGVGDRNANELFIFAPQ